MRIHADTDPKHWFLYQQTYLCRRLREWEKNIFVYIEADMRHLELLIYSVSMLKFANKSYSYWKF